MVQEIIMKALSDKTRLRLMNICLASRDPLCVCEMGDALRVPQYQVSRHLLILKNAGLVKAEKEGIWGYYSLDRERQANQPLFLFLKSFLDDGVFADDREELRRRLLLREDGKCVVGYVPKKELKEKYAEQVRLLGKEKT